MKFGFQKICAITPEIRLCDVEYNAKIIKEKIVSAEKKGASVIVFPELALTGYTVGDLIYTDALLSAAKNSLKNIAEETATAECIAFIGLPLSVNGLIYNVAGVINKGKVIGFIPKTFYPNYNEFYEKRYFAEKSFFCDAEYIDFFGEKVPFGQKLIFKEINSPEFSVAAEICEDLWSPLSPSEYHAVHGANIIVNLSASDETVGKAEFRKNLVKNQSAKTVSVYVYADAGMGESTTDVVYSGHDLIAENGKILSESKPFGGGVCYADADLSFIEFERRKVFNKPFNSCGNYLTVGFSADNKNGKVERIFDRAPFVPKDKDSLFSRAETILDIQSRALAKRVSHTHTNKLVVGLSGGLDSTLAAIVAAKALSILNKPSLDLITVTMPCFGTTSRTFDNACGLAKGLGATLKKVDITKSVLRHLKDIKHGGMPDVTYENAQARERTQVLMDIANMCGGLVVGTGDLSELALGWATYNGDHMSMYGVNCSVPKTLVKYLVSFVAENSKGKLKWVLDDILDTPVSPELLPAKGGEISQKTEDIVGPYILHDFFLFHFIRRGASAEKIKYLAVKTFHGEFSEETVEKWLKIFIKRFFAQQFKRSCVPDGVKVGSVALSPRGDWRMPSDAIPEVWLKNL